MEIDAIYNQDCLEGMKNIPDGSIDMILCDLPYGVLNRQNRHAKWDNIIPFEPLWGQYKRVIKKNGAIVLFGQGMFTAELMLSNQKMWRYNLIWEKDRPTGFLNANRMPLRSHEDICVFYTELPVYHPQKVPCKPSERNHPIGKGKHKDVNQQYGTFSRVVDPIISDDKFPRSIIRIDQEHKCDGKSHPTQKPVALCEWLIKTYSNVGDSVLDNCMGSGTTAVACINTDRHYIGFETDPSYYELALSRCRDAVMKKRQSLEEWL